MQRFEIGRHIRINTPNITKIEGGEGEEDQWYYGEPIRGKACMSASAAGTCELLCGNQILAPCTSIYTQVWRGRVRPTSARARTATVASIAGRGRRSVATSSIPDEQVAACENGGVCKEKDTCECVTALSVLHEKFPNAPGGATGWQGTDCTMPICVQGYAQCINQIVACAVHFRREMT